MAPVHCIAVCSLNYPVGLYVAANRPRLFTKSVGLRCLTVKRRKIELLDTVIVCWTESRNIGFFWVDGICGSGQSGTVKNGGVENAGVDISARSGKGGHCRSGQISTIWQGWTLREWTMRHHMAGVDFAGVDNAAPLWQGWRKKLVQVSLTETVLYYT